MIGIVHLTIFESWKQVTALLVHMWITGNRKEQRCNGVWLILYNEIGVGLVNFWFSLCDLSKTPVVSLSTILYPYCLILIGPRNGLECEFTIELKLIEGLMIDWRNCQIRPLVIYRQNQKPKPQMLTSPNSKLMPVLEDTDLLLSN